MIVLYIIFRIGGASCRRDTKAEFIIVRKNSKTCFWNVFILSFGSIHWCNRDFFAGRNCGRWVCRMYRRGPFDYL